MSRWLAARERNLATALAPLIALLAAWSPLAARGDETNPPVRALDKVDVIAAPPQDDRRESTTTRIVVSHDEIVRYGDTSLADVLRRLPGVTVDGVPGRDRAIRLRGLGNGYTRVLLNGDPVPPGFSLDSLEPSQIERIEILRAPTADLGAQAIAGTINIVLRNERTRGTWSRAAPGFRRASRCTRSTPISPIATARGRGASRVPRDGRSTYTRRWPFNVRPTRQATSST
ncbi:MAG TPA: Plug domain-containing protein, partial [Casimicrobiaceae bacterium]